MGTLKQRNIKLSDFSTDKELCYFIEQCETKIRQKYFNQVNLFKEFYCFFVLFSDSDVTSICNRYRINITDFRVLTGAYMFCVQTSQDYFSIASVRDITNYTHRGVDISCSRLERAGLIFLSDNQLNRVQGRGRNKYKKLFSVSHSGKQLTKSFSKIMSNIVKNFEEDYGKIKYDLY